MHNIVNTNNFQYVFQLYISECEYTKRLSPHTIKGYKEVFNIFQKIMPKIVLISDLSPQGVNVFFKRLDTRKRIVGKDQIRVGVKPSTTRTYYNKLIAFIRWLENNNYCEKFSLSQRIVKPPEPVYDDERALSDSEVAKIISAISTGSIDNPLLYKRDMVIINLFLFTGIRKGEMLGIRNQDIDFEKNLLFINGATSKSKRSRYVPMHFTLMTSLKSYLEERKKQQYKCENLIISSKFDKPLTTYGLKFWVSKYKELSGVKFHVHRFRHTFACSLAKANADITSIMKVLGHTSIRMTERYLRSIKIEDSRPYIDKICF